MSKPSVKDPRTLFRLPEAKGETRMDVYVCMIAIQ